MGPHTRARGHGRLDGGVAVLGGLHTPDAAVGGACGALDLEGEGHLVVGGDVGQVGAVEIELGGRDTVGIGQTEVLVLGGESCVVARFGESLGDRVGVERPGVREALTVAQHHAHADALGLRR